MPRWDDDRMDPVLALSASAALLLGVVLALSAMRCRSGRGGRARSWVRSEGIDARTGHAYGEVAVLVVLPLLAQSLLVAGLLMALGSVEMLRGAVVGLLVPAAVVAEVLLWIVLLLATGYRAIMPLWVYPSWLRPQRRREREVIRSR
ncbi:hypothetical protein [Brachybacterium sacelli]